MSDEAEGTPFDPRRSRYVIQRAVVTTIDGVESVEESVGVWQDVGTVEVPMRSQRKTAVAKALEQFEIPEDSHPSVFRALDEDAVEEIPVTFEVPPAPPQPPAVLKVGR